MVSSKDSARSSGSSCSGDGDSECYDYEVFSSSNSYSRCRYPWDVIMGFPLWWRPEGALRILYYAFTPGFLLVSPSAKETIRRSFSQWAAVSPFDFLEISNRDVADIIFTSRPIDEDKLAEMTWDWAPGSGETTARVEVVFDSQKVWKGWTADESQREFLEAFELNSQAFVTLDLDAERNMAYDLETVAAHEIGHALGLDHSICRDAVMYPITQLGEVRAVAPADAIGVQLVYGPPLSHLAPGFPPPYPGVW